jgi:hypothetical protein
MQFCAHPASPLGKKYPPFGHSLLRPSFQGAASAGHKDLL